MIHKNLTIAAYDRFAEAYDQGVASFWANFPRAFLVAFAAHLPGKRVLSLGSGSGRDALLLRELGLTVTCVDAAPQMVAITKNLGFDSHLATFEDLRFDEASFDGVWAHGSLLHVPKNDARTIILRVRQFLKQQGVLALGMIQGTGVRRYDHPGMPGHTRYCRLYQNSELQSLVSQSGFAFLHQQDYVLPYDTFINHLYQRP